MPLAKYKETEKPTKRKQRTNPRTRERTSGKTNTPPSWLALICIRQVQGEETKHINRGSQDGLRSLLWGWHILMSQGCTMLCLPNKTLSCNTSLPIQIFTAERTEEINTIPTYLGLWLECNVADTASAGPQQGGSQAEVTPTWQKLTLWKLNTKETQSSRSQEKPSMLETKTAKMNSCNSVSDFRRPPVKVRSPHPCGWKDIWLKKCNSYKPLISCLLKPLWTGEWQWMQLRVSVWDYFPMYPESSTIHCTLVAIGQAGEGSFVLNLLCAKDPVKEYCGHRSGI